MKKNHLMLIVQLDEEGVPILQEKSNLSLYDVEYKLDGLKVVPVDKNTGKVLDEKQDSDTTKTVIEKLEI